MGRDGLRTLVEMQDVLESTGIETDTLCDSEERLSSMFL